MTGIDLFILIVFLSISILFGIFAGRHNKSEKDFFCGGRQLPWGAVSLSVVATETSTLTFISIPGIAYVGNLNFLQLAFGYVIGRIIVSFFLLPAYFEGNFITVYEFLNKRFGILSQRFVAIVFQLTRLLADGVRLFATAIPLSLITDWSYTTSISIIAVCTIIYTYSGGIRAVVWMDVFQGMVYFSGAIITIFIIINKLGTGSSASLSSLVPAEKWQIFYSGFDKSIPDFFKLNYTFLTSIIGGAFLSLASHGTDQLIVQRLLSCKTLKDSQKALITSGFLVVLQFALFLFLGLLLYAFYQGAEIKPDTIFPIFIINELPAGLSGIIIAAIFAAAMSTLSSSLNSLASSTVFDILNFSKRNLSASNKIMWSRLITLIWGVIFIGAALIFKGKNNPVVELGLTIASFTYGGMLGIFLLGRINKNIREINALSSLWCTLIFMTWLIGLGGFGQWLMVVILFGVGIWLFYKSENIHCKIFLLLWGLFLFTLFIKVPTPDVAWPLFVPIGTFITLLCGKILTLIGETSHQSS